ncbi:MAG: SusC/RagA family TonB-linked outer membrane protein [Allomuricauda sp.]
MIKRLHYLLMIVSLLCLQGISAQGKTVSGTVTDATTGTPLPGINVVEKGTTNGTSTDFDGNYTINVSNDSAVLVFSALGYTSREVTVGGQSVVNTTLDESTEALDEVVVTALGLTREKKSLGYAVTELQSEEVNQIKNFNVANSLVGKVAGLTVSQSGGVGSGSRIVIRGNNSITGRNQALIVVDGIPINDSGNESGGSVFNSSVTGGGITDINPEDIESVTVLKGPNAAALYGSRAASGAIVITTKTGERGKGLGITFNSNVTLENPMFLPDYQNEFGQGTNGAVYPDLAGLGGSSWGQALDGSQQIYFDGVDRAYSAQPNNVSDFFETGLQNINSISFNTGGENFSTRFSYTNNSTTTILPNSGLDSHSFNLRGLVDLSDKLSVDAKVTYFNQELNNRISLGSEGVLAYVYYMPRNIRVDDLKNFQVENPSLYDPDNNISDYDVISYTGQGNSTGNPYWILNQDSNKESRNRFLGLAKVDYKFNDWLSLFVRMSGDVTNVRSSRITAEGNHFSRFGGLSFSERRITELNSDFLLTSNFDITDKLNLSANLGGNLLKSSSESIGVSGSRFKIAERHILANTQEQFASHSPRATRKTNSLYAAFNFAYDDFLYLDVTGRNDWSSTLSEDSRSFFYPSVNLSLLTERFIDPDREVFDYLKIRGSWAEVGNDTGPFQLFQTYPISSQGYLGLTVLNFPSTRFNPDLKPESVTSSEVGLEASLLDRRLNLDFSYYNIVTTDMIFRTPVNPATGFQFFLDNFGEVQNKGFEVQLGGTPIRNDNFSWEVLVNYSKNDNTVNEMIQELESVTLNSTNSGNVSIRAQIDGGIGDIYGTVWATDDDGNRLVNATGIPIASSETELIGNSQPDWQGGITNTLNYKNLSLRFLIDGRFGGKVYSATSSALDGSGVSERSLEFRDGGLVVDAINTDTGAQNTESITAQQYWGAVSGIAENYIYDQDNIRLRELALTYRLPSKLTKAIGVNSSSLSLIGRNLFFFHKDAPDIDPEAVLGTGLSGQGISSNNVPTIRSLGLNFILNF